MTARYSALAREDLIAAALFVADTSEAAALRLIDAVEDAVSRLAQFPALGVARPVLGRGNLRVWPLDRWIIIYRVVEGTVEVARIIRSGRDLGSLSFDEEP